MGTPAKNEIAEGHVSDALWRIKGAAVVGRLLTVRAETYAALLRRSVPTLTAPPPDALRLHDLPSVKELGTGDRVLAEIDQDGYAFAEHPLDEPVFNRRDKRIARLRYRLRILLRKGEVVVEKRFNRGQWWGLSVGHYLMGQLELPFFNEAAALVHLRHVDNVPRLRDIDLRNRILYIDYIQGQTLQKQVAEAGAKILDADGAGWGGLDEHARKAREIASYEPFRATYADAIGRLAARILEAGVAPLDVKLGNIVIGAKTGRPYWLDFEVAHLASCPLHDAYDAESRSLVLEWFGVDPARFA
jgi:hypothetical protein